MQPDLTIRRVPHERSKMTGSSELTPDPILDGCHASLTAVTDSVLHHTLLEQLYE